MKFYVLSLLCAVAGVCVVVSRAESTPTAVSRSAIATIHITRASSQKTCTGMGFFVGTDGRVVTAWHVLRDAQTIRVTTAEGQSFPARVLAEDGVHDVAVLKVEATIPGLELADEPAESGMPVHLLESLGGQVKRGVVQSARLLFGKPMLQVSTPLYPGLSGTPLLSKDGKVVGVADGQLLGRTEAENISFAVPVGPVRALVDRTAPPADSRNLAAK